MAPSAPSYDEAAGNLSNTNNAVGNLTTDVSNLAPLATSYHAAPSPAPYANYVAPKSSTPSGILPAFWNKITSVAGQGGDIGRSVGGLIETQFANSAKDVMGYGAGVANAGLDLWSANSLSAQTNQLNDRLGTIISSYKSGQLDKQGYIQALNQWNQDNANVSSQLSALESRASLDQQNFTKAAIGTEVVVASLMTEGIGIVGDSLGAGLKSPAIIDGIRAATDTLVNTSDLVRVSQTVETLANSEADWQGLSPLAQTMMRTATTQVLEAAGKSATTGQLTKAIAADILFKYPLYYNGMSASADQIYNELNQNKYGDAVKTIGFNASLLLAGGPIGWGLKNLKGGFSDAMVAMGLRPGSILDELSSRFSNGDRLALGKIAQEQLSQGNEKDVKAMIIGLESNLRAFGGNPAMAINKITDHLSNYLGWGDLKGMSHQEAWDRMVNYWKHSDGLQGLKARGQIEGMAANDPRIVVPGRFSTQDKNGIAAAVTRGDLAVANSSNDAKTVAALVSPTEVKKYMTTFNVDEATATKDLATSQTVSHPASITQAPQTVQDRLNAFDAYVAANPNASYANNPNVAQQVKHLITTIEDPQALHTAINKIPTEVGLEGIPKDYAARMAKDGYIAIVPAHHNLPIIPFSETSGKLTTNAAQGSFFLHAAQPVPVLQSVGNMLTKMGMSPEAAGQTVLDVFTQKFTEAAGAFGFLHPQDDTTGQVAKDTLAKLYNYMKAPTGGPNLFGHYLPISDLRQLTNGDIQRALGVSATEAKTVGEAIMQAHLDVPLEVAGIGSKIMDANFKVNPLAAPFSRLQTIGHFTWNPFYTQARLPLKLEFLTQMQTGGKFPTIAGTNRFMSMFFPGQYKVLNDIIANPDFARLVGGGLGGEADSAVTGMRIAEAAKLPPKTSLFPVAGLVKHMADNAGLDVASFMQQQPQAVSDATQALLHYDKSNSFLNSPLVKTLNVAFFPFRFNVKVTVYMANFLGKQPPAIQYGVIVGMMQARTFLNSPQGQAWYATHSDAIGLFKYLSPLETLSTYANIFSHPGSISSYGELGGLPFGWIPQVTDAAGLTHFGQPYVNPKTGAIAKEYVPTSMYGAINVAIQDLLGSLFSYPGAVVGLPKKGSSIRGFLKGTPGSKDTMAIDNPNVTAQDQQFSQIAQQANSGGITQPTQAAPQTSQSVSVPPQKSPVATPIPKSTSGKRLGKGQFKPSLLPGQSTLGQL